MKNFAIIEGGVVASIIIGPDNFGDQTKDEFFDSLGIQGNIVECESNIHVGFIYNDGDFFPPQSPPEEIDLAGAKLIAMNGITDGFNRDTSRATEGYPEAERMTWPMQQADALAWEADNEAPTPYLDGIATARGIDPQLMREITLTQVREFMTMSQKLVGKRQRLRDQINSASTVNEALSITWEA